MNKVQNIPQGYKETVLGIIPQEWEIKRLKTIATPIKTFSYSRDKLSDNVHTLTYIHYGDIHKSGEKYNVRLDTDRLPYLIDGMISDSEINEIDFPKLQSGDILLPDASEDYDGIGHAWELLNIGQQKVIGGLHTIAIRPNPKFVLLGYGSLMFYSWPVSKALKRIAQGTKVYSINFNLINKVRILLPPLAEQRKIAAILNTWDKAIEKQMQLVEKLELRKKGLMQQLLTGKKRLPGFSGEWKKVKLGDAAIFLSTNSFSREQLNSVKGNILNIHYGDVLVRYSSVLDVSKEDIPYINEQIGYSPKDYVNNGDVIMADTAEDEMVGRCCEVINIDNIKVVSGLHTILIHPIIKFTPKYLGYYLNSERYHKQIISIMQGIKVYSITKDALKNTIIDIPCIEEQAAIANIFSLCDHEILLAKQKLSKFQWQKKGLMQVLLTGKRRITNNYGKY